MDMVKELRMQSLLEGLEGPELEKFAPLLKTIRLAADQYVFRENEPCQGVYLIKSGKLEISKTTPDCWKQPLALLSAGQFLGEIALLEKTSHASDARAIEPTELLFLPREAFEEMEKKEPAVMLKIIKNIAIITGLNVRRMNEKFVKALVNY